MEQIPIIAHEGAMARFERSNKRLWIIVLVLIISLLGTNAGWIYYESQFVTTETTIEAEQDGEGTNIISAGDTHYGTESESNNEE